MQQAAFSTIKQLVPNFMYELIRSRLKKDWSDEMYELHFNEFLKFICIASIYGPQFIPVNQDVDDIWHEYILQTQEYEELCLGLPGKRFIHHASGTFQDYIDNKSNEEVIRELLYVLPKYYIHFGAFEEKIINLWPVIGKLMSYCNMTLEDINELAKESALEL